MTEVSVTFKMEADDPADSIGLSEEAYEMVTDAIWEIGGYDLELNKA